MPRPPSVAEAELLAAAERRKLAVPGPRHNLGQRCLGLFYEVRLRFAASEPASHDLVRRWMRGEADRKGTPGGAKFSNDLAKLLGYESG